MARDTDRDWQVIASTRPYWGVLSSDEYKSENLSEKTLEKFFDSGRQFVDALRGFVGKHFQHDLRPTRTLDFGCGVGRLLLPLALISEKAVGIDISREMLAECQTNADAFGISNIELMVGDDRLSCVDGEFDLINSFIVLQHINPVRGNGIIRKLISMLSAGGIGSLQMTYAKTRAFLQHEVPLSRYYRREGDTIKDIMSNDSNFPAGTIQMYDYDINEIMAQISEVSDLVMCRPTNHNGHLGVHFVFRRGSST